ncbi:MAG TPA: hypothetical protein VEL74_06325, partial [Thermoanaerobaculia bacterium]|nr:hypothetical protein [Thermoanaerobaculia bacterium]
SGLEKEFARRVETRYVVAETPESRELIAELGFRSHGLVIRSLEGEVLWKQADHEVNVEDARQALRELLARH